MDICTVIIPYRSAFPDPLILTEGTKVRIGHRESDSPGWIWCAIDDGKEGFIPENFIISDGAIGRLKRSYDATELTVAVDQRLVIIEEESGWLYCRNENGKLGWIPAKVAKLNNPTS
ncbi:MAG: SH3 domain-containing protein [candidate division Zixibacteria bacterium]